MKKITSLLCAVIFSAFVFSLSAQDIVEQTEVKTVEVKGKSTNNWFISLGGGVSVLQGEQDNDRDLSDRLRYSGEISVGKWFNPYFGARLQLMAGALRGFNYQANHGGKYIHDFDRWRGDYPRGYDATQTNPWGDIKLVDDGFWQDFNYGSATIDLMMNLTNLWNGYYKENKIDIIPYIGAGAVYATKSPTNPAHAGLIGKLGARVAFNLNPKFSIYLEPQANVTSSEFDGYEGNRVIDMMGHVLLGVQFNIRKDFTPVTEALTLEEVNYLNGKINENRFLIENQQSILERQQNLLDKLDRKTTDLEKNKPQSNTVTPSFSADKLFPNYIYFALNSADVPAAEQTKLREAVAYLNANPGSKILLIGYADKLTGNNSYNYKLSRKRAEAVADALKYQGINANRVIIEWKGDKEQPFAQNDWNRVVVMVER
ncbi:MAG: OmpA family protein [Candidatus Symbiothrix sp.]|jgi:outer membrane protein OmpA-like peptidoglycan-associated protein|nr:OmpA family protein [Candidatus Symbiothrix sp.]